MDLEVVSELKRELRKLLKTFKEVMYEPMKLGRH